MLSLNCSNRLVVFGKDHAQTKRRQLVNGAVIKPRREFAIRLPMINGRKIAAS
ncbi:MAG TPA: hypothetical protein VFC32_11255 [Pseudolabrys sp.]|nr:hypothetical protein [Pseudolabrys sp.]